jgi:hypothetical protein
MPLKKTAAPGATP